MKSILLGLCFCLLIRVIPLRAAAPEVKAPEYVMVANYANTPKMNAEVNNVLNSRKHIDAISVGSAGVTLSVRASQADEARKLLAEAIKKRGLQITLLSPEGKVITPESVLEPIKGK